MDAGEVIPLVQDGFEQGLIPGRTREPGKVREGRAEPDLEVNLRGLKAAGHLAPLECVRVAALQPRRLEPVEANRATATGAGELAHHQLR